MKKKGFTLIELLAVIAILSLLVILVMPRIIKLYEESKVKIFRSESESFYKALESEIFSESLKDRTKKVTKSFSSLETENYSIVDMDGRSLIYCAEVVQNKIKNLQVSDGVYKIEILDKDNISFEDIDAAFDAAIRDNKLELNDENELFLSCAFSSGSGGEDGDDEEEYVVEKLTEKIKKADTPKSDSTISFSESADSAEESGLFTTSDLAKNEDGKVVYYYRGIVENNYVLFAGYCFRIVRINEDGSVKLRYSGIPTSGACPQTYSSTLKGINNTTYAYGKDTEDNTYVGYMHGSKSQSNYANTHANTNNSNAKDIIDAWYRDNIVSQGTSITSKIVDTIYCNDRSIGAGGSVSKGYTFVTKGYGINNVLYGAARRITPSETPSTSLPVSPQYKCPDIVSSSYYGTLSGTKNNKFTLKTSSGGTSGYGNNKLTYPVALLTADEVVYAGGKYKTSNHDYYLAVQGAYTTMTPAWYTNTEQMYIVNNGDIGLLGPYWPTYLFPVISLGSEVLANKGNGNYNKPYEIKID